MDFCGFTGVDNLTPISQLIEISERYPFVEWGVSFSSANMGQPRYPTLEWITQFLELSPYSRKAAHLCYESLSMFANNQDS
jgi:hypothetical protein